MSWSIESTKVDISQETRRADPMALHKAVWGAEEHRQRGRAEGESADAMAAVKCAIEEILRLAPFSSVGHVWISAGGHSNPLHGEPRETEYLSIYIARAMKEEAVDVSTK